MNATFSNTLLRNTFNFHIDKINVDKTFNADGFRHFVKNHLAIEDYQKAIADNVITKCTTFLRDILDNDAEKVKPGTDCSKITLYTFYCVELNFFMSCPSNLQNPSDACVDLRERHVSNMQPDYSRRHLSFEDCCQLKNGTERIELEAKLMSLENECEIELGMIIFIH